MTPALDERLQLELYINLDVVRSPSFRFVKIDSARGFQIFKTRFSLTEKKAGSRLAYLKFRSRVTVPHNLERHDYKA